MNKKNSCSNCRHQMTGWDGGFFGEPMTCECRIYGVTEGRKGCSNFKKRITKSDLLKRIRDLKEENERLRNQLERKTLLLKIRTKHIDDREKSFHELLNYLESFCYKSNIDGNYAKQDIINILNNWEIREYD